MPPRLGSACLCCDSARDTEGVHGHTISISCPQNSYRELISRFNGIHLGNYKSPTGIHILAGRRSLQSHHRTRCTNRVSRAYTPQTNQTHPPKKPNQS